MNGAADPKRQARYRKGRRSEWIAAAVLMLKGYRILDLRYRTVVGEIDLVARRRRRIAFVEVKRRHTRDEAMLSVTPKQQDRVMRAAQLWLARHAPSHTGDIGFDVIALAPGRWPYHAQDIFDHR